VTDVVSPDHAQHLRLLEALVFAGTQALDETELADRLPNDADVKRLLADLAEMYAGRGVNLVQVAGGYAFRTAPDLSEKLKIERPVTRKLSRAAIETLAIIAYHQPVTRAEIEEVRGVGLSKGTLDLLFEQNWIKPMGPPTCARQARHLGHDGVLPRTFRAAEPRRSAGPRGTEGRRPLGPALAAPHIPSRRARSAARSGRRRGRRTARRRRSCRRNGALSPNTALFDWLPGLHTRCHNQARADRKRFGAFSHG